MNNRCLPTSLTFFYRSTERQVFLFRMHAAGEPERALPQRRVPRVPARQLWPAQQAQDPRTQEHIPPMRFQYEN